MCDFHDFGLTFFSPYLCFRTFENVKKCVLGGCTITSKAKINVFWNFFFTSLAPSGPLRSKKFQKTSILAFEVIVQPPKRHFSTFSKVQKQKKSETKIMKIAHRYIYVENMISYILQMQGVLNLHRKLIKNSNAWRKYDIKILNILVL